MNIKINESALQKSIENQYRNSDSYVLNSVKYEEFKKKIENDISLKKNYTNRKKSINQKKSK